MNWNPFDLRGPEFLLLYATFIGVVWCLQWAARRRREAPRDAGGLGRALDPVAAGYLRLGYPGAVETAVSALVARGALKVAGRTLENVSAVPPPPDAPEWERAVWTTFRRDRRADRLATSPEFKRAIDGIAAALAAEGAVVGPAANEAARRDAALAVVALAAVAAAKIWIALDRGRTNVWFLVLLAAVGVCVAVAFGRRRLTTPVGTARLAALRRLAPRSRDAADPAATALMVGAWGLIGFTDPWAVEMRGALHDPRQRRGDGGGGCGATYSGGCGAASGGDGGGGGGDGGGGGCGGGGCGGCGGD